MAYKDLHMEGYIIFNLKHPIFESYKIDCKELEISKYESLCRDFGAVVLVHSLTTRAKRGYFHLIIATDRDRIISVERGDKASEDGLHYDLSNLFVKYGKKKLIWSVEHL
ncbi:hypothetical protein NI459_00220 [Acinetobacter schindleri]|uniref:hypothetical protein n=1 Tax=Acinetobacter schindleri TaxID=108981 RepID=UPI00209AE9E6|nr:hypothetical protein [Acinetobacter schindleri]MCO8066082.1 hypothetical protein [Acinetobacter schindleri]